jgi:hypothetical protein
MVDPDSRPIHEQIESVARYLKQGGPRKPAIQDLTRIALLLRRQASNKSMDSAAAAMAHYEGSR